MLSHTEDSNESLFYIQDIFDTGDPLLTRMLSSALLHYAYLPVLVRSLCSLRLNPLLSLNTCLYVLTQTFRILKEPKFLEVLFSALFSQQVPARVQQMVEPKDEQLHAAPRFYRKRRGGASG